MRKRQACFTIILTVKTITPLGYKGTAEYFRKIGVKLPEDMLLNIMKEQVLNEYMYRIEAKPNVISTLKTLKTNGADLNVLTASPHITLDPCLKRLGIFDIFTNVWSCDDFNTTKTDPQIYVSAAKRIGKPIEEILFLDDNYDADRSAKTSGIRVCGVYDKSSDEYIESIKEISDYYIYNFSELLEL